VVQGDQFQVLGESYVAIYDSQRMIGEGGRFYFLAPGDRFNLAERQALRLSPQYEPLDRVEPRPWP
jgi:cyanophycinase